MVSPLLDTEPMGPMITGSSEIPGEQHGEKKAMLDSFEVPTSAELRTDRQAILKWNPLKVCVSKTFKPSEAGIFCSRMVQYGNVSG